ncbi:MAG: heme NO-binding domain-containing protein [Gilvibacter sp.]
MKGIVFTEFLELVEETFGLEMSDAIITESDLPSKGVYTAVGTYEFGEMLQLLGKLSEKTNLSIDDLLLVYGEHFFGVVERDYPSFLSMYSDPIELLSSVENHIHVEVKKIYPEAELPTFDVIEKSENHLVMIYTSSRAMYNFGLGLMRKTFAHFGQNGDIKMDMINQDGTKVKFMISRNG